MSKYEFVNKQTGEVLTLKDMLEEWRNEYDGGDPSNSLGLEEYYERLEEPFYA